MNRVPKVYLETSIISYLTAQPSRNVLIAAHQQITRRWWKRRSWFELFVLTWNCTHIANAKLRGRIEQTCIDEGLRAPVICTPEELES